MQSPVLSHPSQTIPAHGGQLVNRIATPEQRQEFLEKAEFLPRVTLDKRAVSDLEMIAIGGFSPLTGFMTKEDYQSVVDRMRLANNLPWSVPITLSVTSEVAAPLQEGGLVRLDDTSGQFIGVLELTEKYPYDKTHEAVQVYRTDEDKHPGVKVVYDQGEINLAGSVWLLERLPHPQFPPYQIDPEKSRAMFSERGWKTVVGFQT
ncbi:MAG: sulfate adenylyltransferase, partial [Moorea sp. SIO2C4]|nr:sulfate adenylyltransferase [Moorena sp. SIO2C4]